MCSYVGERLGGLVSQPSSKLRKGCAFFAIAITALACLTIIWMAYDIFFGHNSGIVGIPDRVLTEFVTALEHNDVAMAYGVVAGGTQKQLSRVDLQVLADQMSQIGFSNLEICALTYDKESSNRKLDADGLIQGTQGYTLFASTLVQASDDTWRLSEFQLRSDVPNPQVWGAGLYYKP